MFLTRIYVVNSMLKLFKSTDVTRQFKDILDRTFFVTHQNLLL